MQMARILGAVGRVFITAGVLILLFVAYQLWGTGIREAQAQRSLSRDFDAQLDEAGIEVPDPGTTTTTAPPSPTTTEPAPPPAPPDDGQAVAHILIPAIGVDKVVVQGVAVPDLKKGPGHYPDSPLPGQPGNAAIAGHRTTYGAPFNRIDELKPGDEILITTLQGSFRYEVREQQIVSPGEVGVLDDFGDDRLTLTSCNPKYSASQRIVVVSDLVGPAATPSPPAQTSQGGNAGGETGQTLDAGLGGERASAWPALLLGLACALIWVAAWLLGRLWRKWPAYAVGLPVFLVVLFFFFENFSRLLPANF
jgi:sortase A